MTLHRYAKNYVSRFEKKLFSPYKGLSGMVMPLFLHEMGNRLALADCLKSCALCCTCTARCVFEKIQYKVSVFKASEIGRKFMASKIEDTWMKLHPKPTQEQFIYHRLL